MQSDPANSPQKIFAPIGNFIGTGNEMGKEKAITNPTLWTSLPTQSSTNTPDQNLPNRNLKRNQFFYIFSNI